MRIHVGRLTVCVVAVMILAAGCRGESSPTGLSTAAPAVVPAEFVGGEGLFNANCAKCHGLKAAGTDQGPPLVHKIYEPNHHGDVSFQMAVRNGARAHHWQFGDMPPISHVGEGEVQEIIGYVRWLQRQAGIF